MFARVYHLCWPFWRYVRAVCLCWQRTILLATNQVKYGEIFCPFLPSLILRSNVFRPSFPPFHMFFVSPGRMSASTSHSVDVSLQWLLATSINSIHKPCFHLQKMERAIEREKERESKTGTQTTRNCLIKLWFPPICWSKLCCGWAVCQVRCINAMGASDWSDPSTPVMLRQARFFRVKQVKDQEVAPFQLLTVGPLNILEPSNACKCCL